jgi:hypothetical protein
MVTLCSPAGTSASAPISRAIQSESRPSKSVLKSTRHQLGGWRREAGGPLRREGSKYERAQHEGQQGPSCVGGEPFSRVSSNDVDLSVDESSDLLAQGGLSNGFRENSNPTARGNCVGARVELQRSGEIRRQWIRARQPILRPLAKAFDKVRE